jgi:hypothetical protein
VIGFHGKTMARARRVVVVALAVVLSGCGPTQASAQASFDFRFEASMCSAVKLDTFTGTVTRTDRIEDPTSRLSVPLSLTPEQMRTVRREVERIRFFDYPEAFRGVPLDLRGLRSIHPALTWRLEVLDGVAAHAVTGVTRMARPRRKRCVCASCSSGYWDSSMSGPRGRRCPPQSEDANSWINER